MDENPYAPPETSSNALPPKQLRFGFGNLVFLGLGSMFVLLPAAAVMWAISDSRTVPVGVGLGVVVMITLGMLLIAHGVQRSSATIGLVSYALFAIVVLVVASVIVGVLL